MGREVDPDMGDERLPARSVGPSREELFRWDREHFWHPFTQMAEYEPVVIEHAEGCTLRDLDGRAYLDGVSSLWCNVHGHRRRELDEAIRAQLDRVAHTTALGASNVPGIMLAKRLVDLAPPCDLPGKSLRHVFFSDAGATAVEAALKMAFQYWRQRAEPKPEKTRYIAFADAYHGDTIGSVSVGGVARFHAMFEPLLFETLRLPAPRTYRMPAGVTPETACGFYLAQLEELLEREHSRVAALVIEPLVQCAAGMIMHPSGFLCGVRELTRKYDVLLIADEVAVGCGRTGRMFACEHEGVTPDLLCLAKGLTGGYLPLAATLATDEIWQAFLGRAQDSRQFYHGHTYCGNPLGAAVALASLDLFESDRTFERLPEKMARLDHHLQRIAAHPHVAHIRRTGMIAALDLVRDRDTDEPFPWDERRGMAVCLAARKLGVLLRPLGDVLVVMPPLAITLEEIDRLMTALEQGIAAATATSQD
jgi:adenosylmethionine-8-amino-7-oxononanoate aminotransferase